MVVIATTPDMAARVVGGQDGDLKVVDMGGVCVSGDLEAARALAHERGKAKLGHRIFQSFLVHHGQYAYFSDDVFLPTQPSEENNLLSFSLFTPLPTAHPTIVEEQSKPCSKVLVTNTNIPLAP